MSVIAIDDPAQLQEKLADLRRRRAAQYAKGQGVAELNRSIREVQNKIELVADVSQPVEPRPLVTFSEKTYGEEEPKDFVKLNGAIFQNWRPPAAAVLITGEQLGYIEPCGCAGLENQKGGLKRRHTLIKQLEADGWHEGAPTTLRHSFEGVTHDFYLRVRGTNTGEQEPEEYEKTLRESGQVEILSGDILRNKVIDHLVEAAVPVDENGNELSLAETAVEAEAAVEAETPVEADDSAEGSTAEAVDDAATEDEE